MWDAASLLLERRRVGDAGPCCANALLLCPLPCADLAAEAWPVAHDACRGLRLPMTVHTSCVKQADQCRSQRCEATVLLREQRILQTTTCCESAQSSICSRAVP